MSCDLSDMKNSMSLQQVFENMLCDTLLPPRPNELMATFDSQLDRGILSRVSLAIDSEADTILDSTVQKSVEKQITDTGTNPL